LNNSLARLEIGLTVNFYVRPWRVSLRLTEPAFDIDELPPVDFVVLSHYHGDHFDQVVERRLDKRLPMSAAVNPKVYSDDCQDTSNQGGKYMTSNTRSFAIVTGASSGIGYELAKICAENGFEAMMKGEGDVVSGWKNKLQTTIANVTPSDALAEQHRKMAEPGSAKK
jgi:hypothetical protein